MTEKLKPRSVFSRIHSLDLLRGFALLGILIMNIVSFSQVGSGYVNPTVGAGIEGYNAYFHAFAYLFADMRFMSVFSILFGAGVLLFAENAERKGISVWKYHYKRMFFLLIFGFIHAYLIWMGDILVNYAICGSLVFLMRKWKSKTLLIASILFFLVPTLLSFSTYFFMPQEAQAETFAFYTPTSEETAQEISSYTGSYMEQMPFRIAGAIEMQTVLFLIETFWRSMSMMLLGMFLFKTNVLNAKREIGFYKKLIAFSFIIGLSLSSIGLYRSYTHNWEGVWVMNIGHHYNYIASVFIALAYIGIVMIISKSTGMYFFKMRMQAVGRMAFTNYIGTSILCTAIFYGHGLGLFGQFDRLQQWGVILLVWSIILIVSPIILSKYKQGPLEFIWRKLTYL